MLIKFSNQKLYPGSYILQKFIVGAEKYCTQISINVDILIEQGI